MTSFRRWWGWLPVFLAIAVLGSPTFAFSVDDCECEGGATFLKLQYNGPDSTQVVVHDGGAIIFDDILNDGDTFSIFGGRENGRFLTNSLILTAGGQATEIHVSCSSPLAVGLVFGPFTVVNMASRGGGLCIPEPVCPTGTNPVDLIGNAQDPGCFSSLRPVTTAGVPASFVMTARSSVDPNSPTDPDASGSAGNVVIGDDGAGVKAAGCSGSKGISGKGGHKDEELIVTFDAPVSASCVRIGLAGVTFPSSSTLIRLVDVPQADAGSDQTVWEMALVSLDATASRTPQGTTPSFQWSQLSGIAVTLSDPTNPQPTFTAPDVTQATLLGFQVEVTDGSQVSVASVMVAVNPPFLGNIAPEADAGPAKTTVELSGVLLDATGTVDSNGDVLSYQWIQIDGPPVILLDASTVRARFLAPESPIPVTYKFRIIVSDGKALSVSTTSVASSPEIDELIIFISSTASAGYDFTISTGEIQTAYTVAPPWGGIVPFSAFTSLPAGLEIDAFKLRETNGHVYVDMVDRTCLCSTAAECDDGDACNGTEVCDLECGCQPGTPLACDDGDVCNGEETCDPSGGCQSGTPLGCDDGNVCNGAESCDPTTGCQPGSPPDCDDGDPCNGLEVCDPFFGCQPGTPVDCSILNDQCHVGVCNTGTGQCQAVPTPGLSCNDSNACTTGDLCDATGTCGGTTINCDDGQYCNGTETCDPSLGCQAGAAPNCDDGVVCTVDSCDEISDSCSNAPDDSACDDSQFCNGTETCDSINGCQAGTAPHCDDSVACTADSCDEVGDTCVNAPNNALCDDFNPCTDDACVVGTGCVTTADDSNSCSDGSFCNGLETCLGGTCQLGSDPCDDSVACTVDACDEANDACSNTPTNGLCNDSLFCNGEETCDPLNGCQAGVVVDCSGLNDQCTVGVCDEAQDTCVSQAANENQPCDDDLFCTVAEVCVGGTCGNGSSRDCSDGVSCTVDTCNENTNECDHAADDSLCGNGLFCDGDEVCDPTLDCVDGPDPCLPSVKCHEGIDQCVDCLGDSWCDDGLFCNGAETCDVGVGVCLPGTPPVCDDSVSCTVDSCDEDADACVNAPNDGLCNDGLFCNGIETCDAVNDCQAGTAVDCDDFVGCTVDTCDEAKDLCLSFPDNSLCDDGLYCNGVETCDEFNDCQAGTAIDCSYLNDQCNAGACDDALDACVQTPANDTQPCDDSEFCTTGEVCAAGICGGGGPTDCDDQIACTTDSCDESNDTCVHAPQNSSCDDSNPCTDDVCDPVLGCVNTPNDLNSCDDGLYCNGPETCQGGTCQSGADPCDDSIACTLDQCNEVGDNCINIPNSSLCTDNLYCNGEEVCNPAIGCEAGPEPDCDDLISCTVDGCDESTDTCTNVPDDGLCSDDDVCTGTEICNLLTGCQPGSSLVCNDQNPCTDDSCDATDGCQFLPNDSNTCSLDSSLCTLEACIGGTCTAIGNVTCPADTECSTFTCNDLTGVCGESPINEGQPCTDDGNECTDDLCVTGTCEHPDVSNNTPCTSDGNECTDDVCLSGECSHPDVTDGIPCMSDLVDCTLDVCINGECENDPMDSFCEDSLYCTGVETCDLTLDCVATGDPCAPSQLCCESGDTCVDECCSDSQCDDSDLCTIDACVAGVCQNNPVTCINDGLHCNGDEVCDPGTGQCVSTGIPCAAPTSVCCEDTDLCVADCCSDQGCNDGDLCTTDQCVGGACVNASLNCADDGLTCNGTEACDPSSGRCVSSGFACPANQVCCESTDSCLDECPEIPTVSQWGLMAMALLLLTGARIYYRRSDVVALPVK